MKHRIIILTLLVATSFLAFGCRQSVESPKSGSPIILGASVSTTKASINDGDEFTAAIFGWEGATADFAQNCKWSTQAQIMAASGDPQTITLATAQFYAHSPQHRTFFKGIHPWQGSLNNGIFTFDNASIAADMDVMLTEPVSGSSTDTEGKMLNFKHLLSQLRFCIVSNTSPAVTLQTLYINDAILPIGVDLTTDEAVGAAPAQFAVGGLLGNEQFDTTPLEVGAPAMIVPFGSNKFKVELVTSAGTFSDVEVTINDNEFMAGKIYIITLKYVVISNDSEIVFDKVVTTEWKDGGNITEDVEEIPVVGKYCDGGIVYWVNPLSSKHYKVVSPFEPSARNQASAKIYCVGFGAGWHLPTPAEAADFSDAYQANKVIIDAGISQQLGTPISDGLYWTDTDEAVNSIIFTTGVTTSTPTSTDKAVRAIKEVQF